MKQEIEESKIIELIRSFEDGRAMQVEALALANARTEEQMKHSIERLADLNTTLTNGMSEIKQNIRDLDGKFAGKLVERIVYTTCAAFGLALIGAMSIILIPSKAQAAAMFILNITS